jgi:predicted GNAT superfamily acetyltransferase
VAGSEAVTIRPLRQLCEFAEALELQKRVWGFADIELLPLRFFVVASKIGGQVFGAFDKQEMVGFCLAVPGLKPDGEVYLHSHMLGVELAYRNSGVGRSLKLYQREDARARQIGLVEWTFDPLELKNAYFNIERLGAIVRQYVPNQYGATSSPLHGGLPTDRCIAEWRVASPRVEAIVAGQARAQHVEERIAFPLDIDDLRRENPQAAREVQQRNAGQFQECFARGLAVTGFERTASEGVYLLERWS